MSTRGSNCLDNEIAMLLGQQSDSDTHEKVKKIASKVLTRRISKLQDREIIDISSDEETIFRKSRCVLPKKNSFQDEKISFRIKLRRSTEQSLYKIDTDSDCKKRVRTSRTRLLGQRKKSCSEIENEESTDNEDKIKSNDKKKLMRTDERNEMLPKTRTRKPPLRYSAYHCETLNCSNNSPSLRTRKNVNYNEDELLFDSLVSNMKATGALSKQKENKDSNVKDDSEPKTPKSSIRNTKRNRTSSLKDNENDSGIDSKVTRTKSMKVSNKIENSTKDPLNGLLETKEAMEKQDLLNTTPVKINKQKRAISESTKRNVSPANNDKNGTDEDYLADMYKHIKISSPTVNTTPIKRNKREILKSASVQKNTQTVGNDISDNEENSLTDMYKRVKISSAKRGTPQRRNNARKDINLQLEEARLNTPKSRLVIRNLAPSMGKRHSTLLKPATPLQEARSRLHVSAVPKSLPCREEEFNNIFTFLKSKLEDKSGGYVEKMICYKTQ